MTLMLMMLILATYAYTQARDSDNTDVIVWRIIFAAIIITIIVFTVLLIDSTESLLGLFFTNRRYAVGEYAIIIATLLFLAFLTLIPAFLIRRQYLRLGKEQTAPEAVETVETSVKAKVFAWEESEAVYKGYESPTPAKEPEQQSYKSKIGVVGACQLFLFAATTCVYLSIYLFFPRSLPPNATVINVYAIQFIYLLVCMTFVVHISVSVVFGLAFVRRISRNKIRIRLLSVAGMLWIIFFSFTLYETFDLFKPELTKYPVIKSHIPDIFVGPIMRRELNDNIFGEGFSIRSWMGKYVKRTGRKLSMDDFKTYNQVYNILSKNFKLTEEMCDSDIIFLVYFKFKAPTEFTCNIYYLKDGTCTGDNPICVY